MADPAEHAQKLLECEAFSCLRQSMDHFLLEYQTKMGVAATHPIAIQACVAHFNLSPVDNQCLCTLIMQLAESVVQGTSQ